MKKKQNAKERREAMRTTRPASGNSKVQSASGNSKVQSAHTSPKNVPPVRPVLSPEEQARMEAEEVRLFLDSIAGIDARAAKEKDLPVSRGKAGKDTSIPVINLEDGMPLVEEAIRNLHISLQEVKAGGYKLARLIHGYGSTGRGGKIRIGVRNELAVMKRRKQIAGFIPGEEFGPCDADSRNLVDMDRSIASDVDYGKCNHGITIVIL